MSICCCSKNWKIEGRGNLGVFFSFLNCRFVCLRMVEVFVCKVFGESLEDFFSGLGWFIDWIFFVSSCLYFFSLFWLVWYKLVKYFSIFSYFFFGK